MNISGQGNTNISTKASVEFKLSQFNPVNLSVSIVYSQTKFISGGSEGARIMLV